MKLRPYQQRAHDAVFAWMKKNLLACMIDLATSSGKSVIGAFIAETFVKMTGKKALIICPTADLVRQNAEKCRQVSGKVSVYSASIDKCLRNNVVVCTPQTFANIVDKTMGEFGLVIIDEGEGITKAIIEIVDKLREKNPNLRVVGMTGTPWRTSEGYVAEINVDDSIIDEAMDNPFYKKIVARVSPKELIDLGFAVPPKLIQVGIKYDTENIVLKGDHFSSADQDRAFLGQGRKTSAVVEDFINYCNSINARGVIIYASSIKHCDEIMQSMPHYNTGVIHGKKTDTQNNKVIQDFRDRKIKYLINVNKATVGLSVDHVDALVVMRLTESTRLYMQMLGRGMRLLEGEPKPFFSVLDYTDNIKNLFPDGDLLNPEVKAYGKKPTGKMLAYCPDCGYGNEVSLRPNPEELPINDNGYFVGLDGNMILIDGQPYPAHYTRRCGHMIRKGHDEYVRCDYYWTCKECEDCGHKNDISARFCEECKSELIDPNAKLKIEFDAKKKDPKQIQTDEIIFINSRPWRTKVGGDAIKINIGTHDRIVEVIVSPKVQRNMYEKFKAEPNYKPTTVTYKKSSSGYFHIYDFNRPTDLEVFNKTGKIQ